MKRLARSAAMLVAALGLGACGGSDDGGSQKDGDAHSYRGTGYELTAPEPWTNVTDKVKGSVNPAVDLMLATSSTPGSTSVNIVRQPVPTDASLAEVAEEGGKALDTAGYDRGPFEDATLGSEPAKSVRSRIAQEQQRLELRQVIAKRGKAIYTVSFVARAGAVDRDAPAFDAMLESWRWR